MAPEGWRAATLGGRDAQDLEGPVGYSERSYGALAGYLERQMSAGRLRTVHPLSKAPRVSIRDGEASARAALEMSTLTPGSRVGRGGSLRDPSGRFRINRAGTLP